VELNETAREAEAQPAALVPAGSRIRPLLERIEDLLLVVWRDAHAIVHDLDANAVWIVACRDDNVSSARGELDRVR
jgi:hypothetical protein